MDLIKAYRRIADPIEERLGRRPDGHYLSRIHPYRKMLAFVSNGSNESIVYYEDLVRAQPILDYIERARAHHQMEVDLTHCLVAAVGIGMYKCPEMNRFVLGRRLYQRNHVAVTFSVKRKRMDKKAKVSAIKMFFEEGEDFVGICRRINEKIGVERSDTKTYADKEMEILAALPRPLLAAIFKGVRLVDYYNLLPNDFIKNDAFYTSMFIANLGSLGMNAGYHHLYEWGTCPLFMMVGKIEDRPVVVDGEVKVEKILPIHWTYDERIDDGLTSFDGIKWVRYCMEKPEEYFGAIPGSSGGAG